MKYDLLVQLIGAVEKYEENATTSDEKNLKNFAHWLYNYTHNLSTKSENDTPCDKKGPMPLQGSEQAKISQLLVLMYKYLKFYLRKIFAHTPLTSSDDFGFLGTLFVEGSLQKNELIIKNTMEFTSGVEIIKRLEQKGLIASEKDETDKRAKRVALTPLGRATFLELLPTMARVGRLAMANLTHEQQSHLFKLLEQLHLFHAPIFQYHKNNDIENILDDFIE